MRRRPVASGPYGPRRPPALPTRTISGTTSTPCDLDIPAGIRRSAYTFCRNHAWLVPNVQNSRSVSHLRVARLQRAEDLSVLQHGSCGCPRLPDAPRGPGTQGSRGHASEQRCDRTVARCLDDQFMETRIVADQHGFIVEALAHLLQISASSARRPSVIVSAALAVAAGSRNIRTSHSSGKLSSRIRSTANPIPSSSSSGRRLVTVRSVAAANVQHMGHNQRPDRFPGGTAGAAQHDGQFLLRRQPAARLEIAGGISDPGGARWLDQSVEQPSHSSSTRDSDPLRHQLFPRATHRPGTALSLKILSHDHSSSHFSSPPRRGPSGSSRTVTLRMCTDGKHLIFLSGRAVILQSAYTGGEACTWLVNLSAWTPVHGVPASGRLAEHAGFLGLRQACVRALGEFDHAVVVARDRGTLANRSRT